MYTHVLMFKFKDPEVCVEEAGRRLLTLPALIPEIQTMEYHIDELKRPRSYHACLLVTYKDEAAYHVYDTHPEHNKVREYIHAHVLESHTVDYNS